MKLIMIGLNVLSFILMLSAIASGEYLSAVMFATAIFASALWLKDYSRQKLCTEIQEEICNERMSPELHKQRIEEARVYLRNRSVHAGSATDDKFVSGYSAMNKAVK